MLLQHYLLRSGEHLTDSDDAIRKQWVAMTKASGSAAREDIIREFVSRVYDLHLIGHKVTLAAKSNPDDFPVDAEETLLAFANDCRHIVMYLKKDGPRGK